MSASLNTARALLSAKNYDSARRAVQQVLEAEPEDINALILLVDVEMADRKHARALAVIEQALSQQPHDFRLRNCELETYIMMGKKRRARLGIQRYREDFPQLPHFSERQDILYEMKFGSDRKAVKKLKDFSPSGNEAAEGVLQTNAGRLWEGQRLLNIALQEDPTDHMVNKSLAVNQLLLARPTSARRAARRGLETVPTDGQLRWIKAMTWCAYFPTVYLWHLLLAMVFMVYGRLGLLLAIPIGLALYFILVIVQSFFVTMMESLGIAYFSTFSTFYALSYFVGFTLIQTSIPNRVFGSKRKVKFKDY